MKDTNLLRSEGANVKMKSRREDDSEKKRREEKVGRRRKTLPSPDEETRLSFQAQKGFVCAFDTQRHHSNNALHQNTL
jgi:hypothetical protein